MRTEGSCAGAMMSSVRAGASRVWRSSNRRGKLRRDRRPHRADAPARSTHRRGAPGRPFGLRQIKLHPGMAVVAIGTLAIAMAANTAVFAVVNALVLKPLPVAAPDELARIKAGETQMAWANYDDIRRTNTVFSDVAAYRRLVLRPEQRRSVRPPPGATDVEQFLQRAGRQSGASDAAIRRRLAQRSRGALGPRVASPLRRRSVRRRTRADARREAVQSRRGDAAELSRRGSARVIRRPVAAGRRHRSRCHPARSRRVGVRGRGTSAAGRHARAGDV